MDEFVKLRELSIQAMSSIKGIGKKSLEKYGKEFLDLLEATKNETGGK